ncbi:MAG TPA: branched-chain amino acid ABC transporter permease [Pyrinomonadaceae bacterium]|nr:branched-chain amino acid ABC transporter permease [Pyrinomonadaceae bacterium]
MGLVFQLLVNGLIAGSLYALVGLGFALEYRATKFFNFSFAAVFAVGAYSCWAIIKLFNLESESVVSLPFVVAAAGGVIAASLLGWLLEVIFYGPLRQRLATPLILLLASLGIFVIVQNTISLLAGDDVKVIRPGQVMPGLFFTLLFGATVSLTKVQLGAFLTALGLGLVLSLILKFSSWGKKFRAVANDTQLANIFGINTNRIHASVHAIGGALAGVAAIWMALDTDLTPLLGFRVLVVSMAAMVIGGVRSLPGVVLGAMIIGLFQNLVAIQLDTKWQDTGVFLLLLAFLLFRPQGLLGAKFRST